MKILILLAQPFCNFAFCDVSKGTNNSLRLLLVQGEKDKTFSQEFEILEMQSPSLHFFASSIFHAIYDNFKTSALCDVTEGCDTPPKGSANEPIS